MKRMRILLLLVLALSCAGCGSRAAQTVSEPVPAEAAEQGLQQAQMYAGFLYLKGMGVPPDRPEANSGWRRR